MTNDVSPQLHLAFLNDAWSRASDATNSLLQTLQSDQIAALALVKTAGSIASVGKNSTSQSYTGYGAGKLTAVQIVEAIGNLLALYAQLQDKITRAFEYDPTFGPTVPANFDFDTPIFNLLTQVFTAQSTGRSQLLPDLTGLRLPPGGILSPGDPGGYCGDWSGIFTW